MGKRVNMKALAVIAVLLVCSTVLLMRFGFIVFDRHVFDFQVQPIIKADKVTNIREYKIIHEYLEMSFERDPDKFASDPLFVRFDAMLGEYETTYP